jgi:RNA polymerase sigma factor (TIGR02999 family)
MMQRERPDHSMQATELVDTIYLRLIAAKDRDWQNRKHFFAIAARAMRRYLVDHARGRPRAEFVALAGLEEVLAGAAPKADATLAIDRLLDELALTEPEWSTLVEMKHFLGLTDQEAADAMGLKLRTMQRMWRDARQWLFVRMGAASGGSAG